MLNEGKIGCMAIGSWAMSQVRNAGADGKSVAYMPFPNEVDGKQYMTIVTDYCYAINKNSTNNNNSHIYNPLLTCIYTFYHKKRGYLIIDSSFRKIYSRESL